jgi:hypothetical protein
MAGPFIVCDYDAQESSVYSDGQETSMMKQDSGTAAALSIKEKVDPREFDVRLLRKEWMS